MTLGPQDEQARDREDMARLRAGEDLALTSLMDRHAERLFHYLIRQLNDESDAADLAQETFLRVYQNRARFRLDQKFTTWLYAIATNLVRDRFRWRQRHPQVSLDAMTAEGHGILESVPTKAGSPDQRLEAEERALEVRKAVASLPDDMRTALILAEYDGWSHAEIGSVLGCTAKAVENRLYRARAQLRARLEGVLEPCSDTL